MKKYRHLTIAAVFVGLVIILTFSLSYHNYVKYKVSGQFNKNFEARLYNIINDMNHFSMNDVTDFQWDEMYIFAPYLPKRLMEETAGTKWTLAETYPGYLFERLRIDDPPLLDDSLQKLVFLNDKKVVLDVTIERYRGDFLTMTKLLEDDRTTLAVEGDEFKIISRKK